MVKFTSIIFSFLLVFSFINPVKAERNNKHERIVQAVMKMRGNYRYMTIEYARKIVKAAEDVLALPGNDWLTVEELVGLAMNESDLRPKVTTGSYCMWDCGIVQNHTPLFARTCGERRKLCSELNKSPKLSFYYAMKELNTIRGRYYKEQPPTYKYNENFRDYVKRFINWKYKMYRYVFNIYNQGPRYLYPKYRYCQFKTTKSKYRCAFRNRYWLRASCFIKSLELNKKPSITCRNAYSIRWIERVYR